MFRSAKPIVVLAGMLIVIGTIGAVHSACASVMGLEEGKPGIPFPQPVIESDSASASVDPDAGCAGEGCSCSEQEVCRDRAYAVCLNGKCAECSPTAEKNTCPQGQYCVAATNTCALGCVGDTDCAISPSSPKCQTTRHQCVVCLADTDCTTDSQVCSPSGTCVDRCTGNTCADQSKSCCNGLCLDLQSDIFNCGGCTTKCAGTAPKCCAGVCADTLSNPANCGECKIACNTTTVANATSPSCLSGKCTYTACAGAFGDCDKNKANGCECACGVVSSVCCQSNNSSDRCTSNDDYCGSDNICHACKRRDEQCSSDRECCSGDECDRGSHRCERRSTSSSGNSGNSSGCCN